MITLTFRMVLLSVAVLATVGRTTAAQKESPSRLFRSDVSLRLRARSCPAWSFEDVGQTPAAEGIRVPDGDWLVCADEGTDPDELLREVKRTGAPGVRLHWATTEADIEAAGKIETPRILDLGICREMTKLDFIDNFPNVEVLMLPPNVCTEAVLSILKQRNRIREIDLGTGKNLSLPEVIPALACSRAVHLPKTTTDADLKALVAACAEIRGLGLGSCQKLTDFAPIGRLERLEWIRFPRKATDISLECLGRSENLTALAGPIINVDRLTHPERLRYLSTWSVAKLDCLSALTGLLGLRIALSDSTPPDALKPLAKLGQLRRLWVHNSAETIRTAPLANLERLERLEWVNSLDNLRFLKKLKYLRRLMLTNCRASDLSVLADHPKLESLWVFSVEGEFDLSVLAELPRLRWLSLCGIDSVRDLGALAKAHALSDLTLLMDLLRPDELGLLTQLKRLTLSNRRGQPEEEIDISSLSKLKGLVSLTLYGSSSLRNLEILRDHGALRRLVLRDCQNLQDLRAVATLTSLRVLWIHSCHAVTDLSPLGAAPALRGLSLTDLPKAKQLSALARLKTLRRLWGWNCGVRSPDVERLRKALPNCRIGFD